MSSSSSCRCSTLSLDEPSLLHDRLLRDGQLMDPAGAAVLRERLEQQRHWRRAAAVLEGRLPPGDPDAAALREIRGEERVYEGEDGPFAKRLVGGTWERFELGGHAGAAPAPSPA